MFSANVLKTVKYHSISPADRPQLLQKSNLTATFRSRGATTLVTRPK